MNSKNTENAEHQLLQTIEKNVLGYSLTFTGPFGKNRAIYCDYTASGRPLKFIEDFITKHVYPIYANTHTDTGIMARQTSMLREEARQIIKKAVNASDEYVLIFTGSGTTSAVNKLVHCMRLKKATNTVILIGPYEHHSNILPWKECGAKVIRITEDKLGLVDMAVLESSLKRYAGTDRLLIGCFSAASNVTGIMSDTYAISVMLHKYGALAFWDYATAGPYVHINVTPSSKTRGTDPSKDAIYLSPHKFVGGVGTPGVLIARKRLFINFVPDLPGGGTVTYVTRESHLYVQDIQEREEGGTPAIVESIRAGITFHVKELVGTDLIERREKQLAIRALRRWKSNPNLIILGSTSVQRLPIFSFMIVHPHSGKVLHHNVVAVLLNDLYGIQARSGCACAGPYSQDLLGIDETLAKRFTHFLAVRGKFNRELDCHHCLQPDGCNICGTKTPFSSLDEKHLTKRESPLQILNSTLIPKLENGSTSRRRNKYLER
ncbi:cysteine desulfurase SufS-like [Amphiura filiformis]|uniref:cysteine desulfurase SufS-like n=1 Tax=Amphiura filiformis TaxID=82378 RepID=UPI003B215EF7